MPPFRVGAILARRSARHELAIKLPLHFGGYGDLPNNDTQPATPFVALPSLVALLLENFE
jgi:hypothetical protein